MVIESLLPGGKERRLVELLKGLQKFPKLKIELILTNSDVYYKEIFDLNIKIYFVEPGTYKKSVIPFFRIYKICKNSNPQIIHVWGNKAAIYSILPKIFLNIPMINSQISDAPKKIKNYILGPKLNFRFSDLIIANSQAGLDAYKAPSNKS